MGSVKFVRIKKENLPEAPTWLKQMQEDVKKGALGSKSEEEIGELCEELAERGARRQPSKKTSD